MEPLKQDENYDSQDSSNSDHSNVSGEIVKDSKENSDNSSEKGSGTNRSDEFKEPDKVKSKFPPINPRFQTKKHERRREARRQAFFLGCLRRRRPIQKNFKPRRVHALPPFVPETAENPRMVGYPDQWRRVFRHHEAYRFFRSRYKSGLVRSVHIGKLAILIGRISSNNELRYSGPTYQFSSECRINSRLSTSPSLIYPRIYKRNREKPSFSC